MTGLADGGVQAFVQIDRPMLTTTSGFVRLVWISLETLLELVLNLALSGTQHDHLHVVGLGIGWLCDVRVMCHLFCTLVPLVT